MFEDDQVAIAAQARAGIDDATVGRRQHRVTGLAGDRQALVACLRRTAATTVPLAGQAQLTSSSPSRGHRRRRDRHRGSAAPMAAAGAGPADAAASAWRSSGRDSTLGGSDRTRSGKRRIGAGRHDAQHLADLDQVRVLEVVPAHQIFPVLAVLEADADQRVAGLDRVVAGLAEVLDAGQRLDARRPAAAADEPTVALPAPAAVAVPRVFDRRAAVRRAGSRRAARRRQPMTARAARPVLQRLARTAGG